jgi:hypothetical protein
MLTQIYWGEEQQKNKTKNEQNNIIVAELYLDTLYWQESKANISQAKSNETTYKQQHKTSKVKRSHTL